MAKSLTETAKAILIGESTEASPEGSPDRNATSKTMNAQTLAPNSANADPMKKLPDADVQDLGPALVKNTDVPPSAKAAGAVSKDSSKSARTNVSAEPMKKAEEPVKEETQEVSEENEEIPAELREFIDELIKEGFNDEEIAQAIEENFELVEESEEENVAEEEDVREESSEEAPEAQEVASHETEENLDETKLADMSPEQRRKAMEVERRLKNPTGMDKEIAKRHGQEKASNYAMNDAMNRRVDMTESVNAIFNGEQLSEEFKTKAKTIVEAAVAAKISEKSLELNEQFEKRVAEKVEQIKEELADGVDAYLNYVVEEWVKDNEVAIESSLRTELTEDFMAGLKRLFEENYIDIPEEKVSVVDELTEKVTELTDKLNEEIENSVELKKKLNENIKINVLNGLVSDLTVTQADKIKQLAETVDFVSASDYKTKILTLKENYFPKQKANNAKGLDVVEAGSEEKSMILETSGPMAKYVKAIGKTLPV